MVAGKRSKKEEKERRKRARNLVAELLRRVKDLCCTVKKVDEITGQIDDVVKQVKDFVGGTEGKELLPESVRSRVLSAADEFERVRAKAGTFADACEKLQDALKLAEKVLVPAASATSVIAVAVVVIAVAAASIMTLSDGVTISLENNTGSNIELTSMMDFVPGVDFPGVVPQGGKGNVSVPRIFVGRFQVQADEITIEAFGRSSTLNVGNLDLRRSTWDEVSLANLAGKEVSVTGKGTHRLVIHSR